MLFVRSRMGFEDKTWMPVSQDRFPDGTLHMTAPKDSLFKNSNVDIYWKYNNDAELFSLICLRKHYADCKNVTLYMPYCPHAKLVVFSASQEERYPYIADYLIQNNIPFDAINEDVLIEKRKPTRKLYYNILLDDRAGLGSAYAALDMLYNRLEAKGELKTWRA